MPGQQTQQRAIVIGGSMAGLMAARVLTRFFDQVVIIERDEFPDSPAHRKGVPQSYHAHSLLLRGKEIIEHYFPGIMEEMAEKGAVVADGSRTVQFITPFGELPLQNSDQEYAGMSRIMLEWHVRDRLAQYDNVRFVTRTDVTGLLSTADKARITGVSLRSRETQQTETMHANLVVDASGRNSKAPQWLEEIGYDAPPEAVIHADIGYATRWYKIPEDFNDEWRGLIINSQPPHNKRAGVMLPLEDNQWSVTIGGLAGFHPPSDPDEFLEFARQLQSPKLYNAIINAEPISPVINYRTPKSRRRHYERLNRVPQGFIATGDSVCAFNPIYGQGMTTSALDATVLEECLEEQQKRPRASFERYFYVELARAVDVPWLIASSEDLRWDVKTEGISRTFRTRFMSWYSDLVARAGRHDKTIALAYLAVINMVEPPSYLMRPSILLKVLPELLKPARRDESASQAQLTPATPNEVL